MTTYSNKSNATRAAKKVPGAVAAQNEAGEWIVQLPAQQDGVDEPTQDDLPVVEVEHVEQIEPPAEQEATQGVRDGHGEFVEPVYMMVSFKVLADDAVAEADKLAKRLGLPVEVSSTRTGKLIHTASPFGARAKAERPAKAPRVPKAAAQKKAPRDKSQPTGMAARIIELCTRPQGATPAELNDLTNWSKAPWRWLLQGDKKNSYCVRFGYTMTDRTEGTKGAVYKITKITA